MGFYTENFDLRFEGKVQFDVGGVTSPYQYLEGDLGWGTAQGSPPGPLKLKRGREGSNFGVGLRSGEKFMAAVLNEVPDALVVPKALVFFSFGVRFGFAPAELSAYGRLPIGLARRVVTFFMFKILTERDAATLIGRNPSANFNVWDPFRRVETLLANVAGDRVLRRQSNTLFGALIRDSGNTIFRLGSSPPNFHFGEGKRSRFGCLGLFVIGV
ncbi:hypothetical protein L0F63_007083 [Massospora cicadina]|nr:hypothetical protein L0F63_007083 [Massospora cicadina]